MKRKAHHSNTKVVIKVQYWGKDYQNTFGDSKVEFLVGSFFSFQTTVGELKTENSVMSAGSFSGGSHLAVLRASVLWIESKLATC